ncbi:MAG: histidine phosphatase family protein [Candidatus Kerfeldbacteria bacterium CG08_land_8_20_14_0_20_42_7]|uniref:phosphoglycerate mutase (2,3-diphosphoglycerate-dependent) n=1 Tax=Candidatus Kerfeldbacteria bacterium CG08_land_8_20_14_0_20_42_7 TaxID=2014245 RepID=A0A2H0YRL8_9BACT|nr:MAG: histidine phosphatase family protein [Candidatus Kerfeldbacteria bacterium CG08_land_8_20_14_0_20_42_7]
MIALYIVRHGETDYNKQGRYLGRTDISLSSDGIRQAKELTMEVKGFPVDVVISSPLKRTMEMAHIIAPDKDIVKDDHFIERSIGVYEGLTKQEAKNKYPDLYGRNITRIFNEAPPHGETIKQVQERVFEGINELKQKYQGKNILLVSHAFIAKVINKYFHPDLSDEDFFKFVLPLAGIAKYKIF